MKSGFYLLLAWYLKILAKLQLKKQKITVVGVTGSVGKTSCMMAIKAVLEDDFKTKVSIKANSEIGIPLDILGFKARSYGFFDWLLIIPLALIKLLTNFKKYDVYVVEMAIDSPDKPKNMGWLLSIIQPNIGVFLNVFPVNTEPFEKLKGKAIENIAIEKGKLITFLPKNGWAILNSNDKRVMAFKDKTKARVVTFDRVNDLQGRTPDRIGTGLQVLQAETLAVVVAVGKIFGINKNKALKKIKKNFKMPRGRMEIIKGIKNTTLIDSSYNASRESMLLGLDYLQGQSLKVDNRSRGSNERVKIGPSGSVLEGRKVAVLGDMRELGKQAKKEHELVAEKAVKIAEVIVIVGPLMKKYFLPKVIKLGFDKNKIHWFNNTYKAMVSLREKIIKTGDRILIKASQNTLLFEIIVEGLMENPKKADNLLCRRGNFWDKKRRAI
ncbi:MAG: Mur ligase family protein [Patescibacteria group bacterium]|nr:Mur ligase family protein [Patescibacteria group bacterium]